MSEHKQPFSQAADSLKELSRGRLTAPSAAVEAALDPQLALLRRWQMERLAHTHADLLTSERYGSAGRFFLADLYAPRDFSRRDEGFQLLHQRLKRYLPPPLLHILREAILLNELTKKLDGALLNVLVDELGVTDQITPELYAEAYRRCNNYEERVQQIDRLMALGQKIDRVVRLPLIGLALRLAHTPAHRAGWGEIQDFLERGYVAFKHMKGADQFLHMVCSRERQILDRIYAGHPQPFATASNSSEI